MPDNNDLRSKTGAHHAGAPSGLVMVRWCAFHHKTGEHSYSAPAHHAHHAHQAHQAHH